MRITAGKWRGKRLYAPESTNVRPTSDKVRQAIFNMLESRAAMRGAHVLDCFCGTGALGLESLSRGAAFALMIDSDTRAAARNIAIFEDEGVRDNARVARMKLPQFKMPDDVRTAFDVVFIDPPYHRNLILPTLQAFRKTGLYDENTLFIVESEKSLSLGGKDVLADKVYGDTRVHLFDAASLDNIVSG